MASQSWWVLEGTPDREGPGGLQGGGWRARLGLLPLTLLLCRGGNLTLLHFLLGLRTAPDDELVAELVVSILRVCPDLLHKYFKEVTFSFLPRAKATWANNVKLLHKVRLRRGPRLRSGGRERVTVTH